MRRIIVPAALVLLGLGSAVYAHPKLVSATPAPNTTVAKTGPVELHFSEKLMPRFSGADVTMMMGANHAAMKVAGTATIGADGRTLVITPKVPLHAGRYSIAWHAVSVDTHRTAGTYVFAVK